MKTISARTALLPDGWVNDVSIGIGTTGEIISVEAGVAASGQLVDTLLPAPVNVHSHAFQRAMAGMTESRGNSGQDSFWTWRQLMYRFLTHLNPDHVQAIAALVQMEMLEAGYATNVEFHYLHHQPDGTPYDTLPEMAGRIVTAAGEAGIGLTLLPVQYEFGGCDQRPLGPGQVRFGSDPDRYQRLVQESRLLLSELPADARLGVAPHSLRAVARNELAKVSELAQGGPIHMHLAEQIPEVEEVVSAYGARPVEWALENLPIGPDWCLIHCTQMTPAETIGLARSGAVVGLCPITESSLGDGIFDGVRWMNEDGSIAIGSDSNIRISLSEELRTLDYSQRLRDNSRAALASDQHSTGRRLFDAVTIGGAKAAGRKTGKLATGYLADLLAIDGQHHTLFGLGDDMLLDAFVFAGDDHLVQDVWSAGRHVVQGGRHVHRDTILANYQRQMTKLRDRL